MNNLEVGIKDLHGGKILYTAHPSLGVEKLQVLSEPDKDNFIVVNWFSSYTPEGFFETRKSLVDMGVVNPYNYRRTFNTKADAEKYVEEMANDEGFKAYWEKHLYWCAEMEDLIDLYDY